MPIRCMSLKPTINWGQRATNESLRSIMAGLQPNQNDSILAVGGSGDQAFALLEKSGRVCIVERELEGVDYINMCKSRLNEGDEDSFLNIDREPRLGIPELQDFTLRKIYFSKRNRLRAIRSKLDSLEVTHGDIFHFLEISKFNKVYLSNALSYGFVWPTDSAASIRSLLSVSKNLSIGSLIYISDYNSCFGESKNERKYLELIRPYLILEDDLTKRSRILQNQANKYTEFWNWVPAVFRKVN